MKKSLLTAALAVFATGSAFADNAQHRNLLAIERAQDNQQGRVTTVAVYTQRKGVGDHGAYGHSSDARCETRYEIRTNAHGDNFGVFAPAR